MDKINQIVLDEILRNQQKIFNELEEIKKMLLKK